MVQPVIFVTRDRRSGLSTILWHLINLSSIYEHDVLPNYPRHMLEQRYTQRALLEGIIPSIIEVRVT